MKTLIIYDSYFGNTKEIAEIIYRSLKEKDNYVEIFNVKDFLLEELNNIDLLIVGSPTRAFNPSENISKFLKEIPPKSLNGIKVATFDTRIDIEKIESKLLTTFVSMFGYAAEKILKRLIKRGGEKIVDCEWFYVDDKEGPLTKGETKKAILWTTKIKESLGV